MDLNKHVVPEQEITIINSKYILVRTGSQLVLTVGWWPGNYSYTYFIRHTGLRVE